jgi:putative ABC transport system permease protein
MTGQLTLATLRSHTARYVAGGLAIVLGVAFVTAALLVSGSARAAMTRAVGAQYARADVVVFSDGLISADVVRRVKAVDSVDAASGVAATIVGVIYPGSTQPTWVGARSLPADPDLRWHKLKEGRLPRTSDEVAVSELVAADRDLRPGSTLRAESSPGSSSGDADPASAVKVVGIVTRDSLPPSAALVVTEDWVTGWRGSAQFNEVLVRAAPGSDVARVLADVRDAAGADVTVRTVDEHVDEAVRDLTGGVNVLGAFLLGFAAIAVFVATLVVANTFTILLAQRTRELALLRCVGARRGQVRRSVLGESVVLGLVASVVGVAVGTGLAAVAVLLIGRTNTGLTTEVVQLDPLSALIPIGVGVLTTVVAAFVPTRRATRVPPLAALRPELAVRVRSRGGVLRLCLALLMILAGVGMIAVGLRAEDISAGMLLGVAGGALSFLGVLVSGRFVVPALIRLVGVAVGRLGGVPGRLSVANAVRNPGRTAATAGALLVGVTLISLMSVGAASVERTINTWLDDQYPLDLAAEVVDSAGLSAQTVEAVRDVDGVREVTTLRKARIQTDLPSGPVTREAFGVDPQAASSVLRDPSAVRELRDGVAVMGPSLAEGLGVEEGDTVRLRGEDGATVNVRARIVTSEVTPDLLLTARDLDRLAPDAPTGLLWARLGEDVSEQTVISRVKDALGDVESLQLSGGAPERAVYNQVLTIMLLIATGLLGVAVLIALVGVGNTLSLSVIERTREQALLRALGLTRGQLRGMLAMEAVLIAGAAVLLGTVLGIGYGIAGTTVLLDLATENVEYAIPVERLLIVGVVALVAGLVASVLPARRAVRVPPATALADE